MKNFLIELYFKTVKINKTRIQVIDGGYKSVTGVVSEIIEINDRTGFVAFKIKPDELQEQFTGAVHNELRFDNACAKEIIGNNGIFEYEEIDAWLLDLEKITQEGRETITEQTYVYAIKYPNLLVKAKETEKKDGIYVYVQNGSDIISSQTFLYKNINEPRQSLSEVVADVVLKLEKDFASDKNVSASIVTLLHSTPIKALKQYLK